MKKFFRILLLFLSIACLLYIFSNSLEDAARSSKRSGAVTTVVVETVKKVTQREISLSDAQKIVRKSAHFLEFALLGFLVTVTVFLWRDSLSGSLFFLLFCGLSSAVTDEALQHFSNGRAPMVSDVLLDFSGYLTGLGIAALLTWLFSRKRRKKA